MLHAIAPGMDAQMVQLKKNWPAIRVSGFVPDFEVHGQVSA
jgi:hypothetical protein